MEHESDRCTNCKCCSRYCHQRIATRTEGLKNKTSSGENPNYRIIKIGQNTEKSPGNLKRLADTQIPIRNYQLTLV